MGSLCFGFQSVAPVGELEVPPLAGAVRSPVQSAARCPLTAPLFHCMSLSVLALTEQCRPSGLPSGRWLVCSGANSAGHHCCFHTHCSASYSPQVSTITRFKCLRFNWDNDAHKLIKVLVWSDIFLWFSAQHKTKPKNRCLSHFVIMTWSRFCSKPVGWAVSLACYQKEFDWKGDQFSRSTFFVCFSTV